MLSNILDIVLQERTTLEESIEETSVTTSVLNFSSTAITDNPDNWHSFDETSTTFNNIFNDPNVSFNEWKTDNLSIFGTPNTEDTIGWNIFEEPIIVTSRKIQNTNNIESLVTSTIKNYYEHDVVEDIKITNTETTEFFGEYIDSSSTTEFAGYFNDFQESTTNIANFENTAKTIDEEPKMSELILKIMEKMKNPDPVGIPGVDIPDPNPIPDMSQAITFFDKLYFTNSSVRGMSKLRMLYINIDIEALEVRKEQYLYGIRRHKT